VRVSSVAQRSGVLGMAIIAACGAATAWLNGRSAQRAHRIIPAASADTVAD